ncbi:copper resistance system multicopper oxidase [Beggiatoa leptomitoformis]|uniref:Copper resistance system multicopper oxidase n=1 Tax=Beggiatoa leptomitoformis TaxID=288004 RepID=A0A650GD36_9GAMM|nr:copper resistance system multicopper oxidase [Beggiatoa leptomitoformis]ALG67181.1 copper resistance system multicopper oxidase [Beggiatoa leptomitoformis]QGX04053.1 copper resistance system multicopper oxidase [Beggiatoa leptomitoformis]
MKKLLLMAMLTSLCLFTPFAIANTTEYTLSIARLPVNFTGNTVDKITINGSIPGPTLHFTEGDDAVIHVTNKMQEETSVHWHGLLLPGAMDGVPGLNGFSGIKPNETFTYRFKIRQSGTYWYHSHSMGQEQDGHYGAIVISPKEAEPIQADRDYVVMFSDYSDEESSSILANLKMSSDYYQYARRTVGDFWADASKQGASKAFNEAKMWAEMRMLPTDLSDVSGYMFLVNGKNIEQNWTGLFKAGERVRLRFINASAMSFYDVRIPHLTMTVVAADGQPVEPVTVNEFRFGIAETYDVIVSPTEDIAYTIVAEALDRTGFALGTLAPREGMRGETPTHRPRALLTMADMGMSHGESSAHEGHQTNSTTSTEDHAGMAMDHAAMGHSMPMDGMSMDSATDYETGVKGSGWAQAGTPEGDKALSYKDLRYLGTQTDTRSPEREIEVRLGGNMERYIWTMNGKKYEKAEPIQLAYGERVRLKFINDTMMAHPMHLHGMFVQLENGQPAEKLPNKHTVIVAPGDSYSVLLTADEAGEWAFHCHLLYHMATGMMNEIVVAKLDPSNVPPMHHNMSNMEHADHEMKSTSAPMQHDMSNMEHADHEMKSTSAPMQHDMSNMEHADHEMKSTSAPMQHDMSNMEHADHEMKSTSAPMQHDMSNMEHAQDKSTKPTTKAEKHAH